MDLVTEAQVEVRVKAQSPGCLSVTTKKHFSHQTVMTATGDNICRRYTQLTCINISNVAEMYTMKINNI